MSKIGLIIKREYVSRVRKKSFIVMTLLTPILSVLTILIPTALANSGNQNHKVVVVDATHNFCGVLTNSSMVNYDYGYCNFKIDEVRKIFMDSSKVTVMYVPPSEQVSQIELYSKADPGDEVISAIQVQMNNIVERAKMKAENLDQSLIDKVKTSISVKNVVNNEVTNSTYNLVLAFGCAILIYIFIFLYSVQVMRGVMEEKVNRIVEVIISSVKPFQLMMGKVVGVGLTGLTQFVAWVLLAYVAYSITSQYVQKQAINPDNYRQEQTMKKGMPEQSATSTAMASPASRNQEVVSAFTSVDTNLRNTNWSLIIICFLFYFICGYLLYSALFAAIGSAVDQETDTQQFMLPVTAPLILSYIVMINIVRDPHSSMAFWFSIIPLTSPISMMARIPFGVSVWELLLSMFLLIAGILGTIWIAGRIYRIGLLMYGKKVTYKELGKWLFYK
ncbi:MAG: ABC transporter permease [Bacteroidia bacterium]